MGLIFNLITAAEAKGTHHRLALDALLKLSGPEAQAWQRLFLKEARAYTEGAKAPDDTFKDFRNHVLHPEHDYWGGAPEKAESWYAKLVEALRQGRFHEAVYAAGILSHYLSDPLMPLHTGSSETGRKIHRACEWTVSRTYSRLIKLAEGRKLEPLALGPGKGAVADLVCRAADRAHLGYDRLIAHYNFERGVSVPAEGLDPHGQQLIGELLSLAVAAIAGVLDRAIAESGAAAPRVSLSLEAILAGLKIPMAAVLKRIEDGKERAAVAALYHEFTETGRVDATLPDDDRTVRDLFAAEVEAPVLASREAGRKHRVTQALQAAQQPEAAAPAVAAPSVVKPAAPAHHHPALAHAIHPAKAPAPAAQPKVAARPDPLPPPPEFTYSPVTHASKPAPAPASVATSIESRALSSGVHAGAATAQAAVAVLHPRTSHGAGPSHTEREPSLHLTLTDPVEHAPAIGPKTAERLATADVHTVGDLLKADPKAVAAKLAVRHITPDVIADWQDEARLVLAVPGLRASHAEILVGSGFRSVEAIAHAEPSALQAAVLKFAQTHDGARVLRHGDPPDLAKLKHWIELAAAVAKAA